MNYLKTKSGLAICPFFIWQSENIGAEIKTPKENDVELIFCTHLKNEDNCEGNCREDKCPLLKE